MDDLDERQFRHRDRATTASELVGMLMDVAADATDKTNVLIEGRDGELLEVDTVYVRQGQVCIATQDAVH